MKEQLSKPAIVRLCAIYQLLGDLEAEGVTRISSAELGKRLSFEPHNVRKDISFLGESDASKGSGGYAVGLLRSLIGQSLGLLSRKKACVVGLGHLGSAVLDYSRLFSREFDLVAGFDSNINLLETIRTSVPVFPAHQIIEKVGELQIELGILAVPQASAQDCAERLIEGGVKGIVNFAPVVIRSNRHGVHTRNVDIFGEFRILSSLIYLENRK